MTQPLFPQLAAPTDALALELDGVRLSWRALARRVAGHQALLAREGLPAGARIGVWTQPSLDTLVALVGNAALGLVSVPVDPKLGPMELGHVLDDSKPLVTLAADVAAVQGRAKVKLLEASREGSDAAFTCAPVNANPALILYTSGTTGLPKGAVLSARNLASNLDALASAWQWTARDLVVHSLPMFHVHGLVLGLFGSLRAGGALHWVPRFEPKAVARALRSKDHNTVLFAVPTMYHRLIDAAADPEVLEGLRAARLLVSGSAALPTRDHQRLEAITGRRLLERYGLTETIINCAVRLDDPPLPGRVGRPLEGIELRLVDEQHRPLGTKDDATIGEIQVRGPNVFSGYLNRPEATAAVIDPDGWFSTGDLATQSPDGVVRIVGRRATDLIKCGGYKVGAGEVEAALLEHPAVREAAVLGAPDADLGERIVAFVVPSGAVTPAELEQFVAGQLSPHKRPREVRLLEALPRNAMGKVLKTDLKKGLG